MSAVAVLESRLTTAEGERPLAYDDATGLRVSAPKGHLSWGRGFNLDTCGSPGLFAVMEHYLLAQLDAHLKQYAWYAIDDVRASVLLEIAYNAGEGGLMHFPHMLAAVARQDWASAATECRVNNPELTGRYEKLSKILLTGMVT